MTNSNKYILKTLVKYLLNNDRCRNGDFDETEIKVTDLITDKELDHLIFYIDVMTTYFDEDIRKQKCESEGIIYKPYFRRIYKMFDDWNETEAQMRYYER